MQDDSNDVNSKFLRTRSTEVWNPRWIYLNGIFGSRFSTGTARNLVNSAPFGHAESGQSTMTPVADCQADSARTETLRRGGLTLDEACPDAPGEFTRGLDRADEMPVAGSIGLADEADVVLWIHVQSLEDRC